MVLRHDVTTIRGGGFSSCSCGIIIVASTGVTEKRSHEAHQALIVHSGRRTSATVPAKPAGQHLREHGQEGGRATAEKHRTKKTAIGRKVAAMNAAKKKRPSARCPHGEGQGG